MADIIVSKVQARSGLRRDLPQPLSPAESGFCLDTGQLFIGADPSDPNSFISPVVEVFNPSTQTTNDANVLITSRVVQIDLVNPTTSAIIASDFSANVNNVVINESGNRAYIGYFINETPPIFPILNSYTISNGYLSILSGDIFIKGVLDLSQALYPDYSVEDTGSIAYVMNQVYTPSNATALATQSGGIIDTITLVDSGQGYLIAPTVNVSGATSGSGAVITATINSAGVVQTLTINNGGSAYDSPITVTLSTPPATGLVKVSQNIEVITEVSSFPGATDQLFTDYNEPTKIGLGLPAIGPTPSPTGIGFSAINANSFIVEYSISNGTTYNRVGTLTIASIGTSATLNDMYTEINPGSYSVIFTAEYVLGTIEIHYTKSNTPENIALSVVSRRWKSF